MFNCVIKFDGKDYVPVRAVPAVTFDRFDPFAVTRLLGGKDRYIFARSYHVETTGLTEASPHAWRAQENTQLRLRQEGASDVEMIKALPAGMLVPLDELTKAYYDAFIEPRLTHTPSDDSLVSDPAFLTGPCTRLFLKSVIYDLVMEGLQSDTISISEEQAKTAAHAFGPAQSEETTRSNTLIWDDAKLRALIEESILPGVTYTSLAAKHGVSRQRISTLLKKAGERFKTGTPHPFSQLMTASRFNKGKKY